MASTTSPQKAAEKYRERIKRLGTTKMNSDITPWPGLTKLRVFIEDIHVCTKPPKISIVNIPGESGYASKFSITPLMDYQDLLCQLPSLPDTSQSSQLIIVENICPSTLALLGGAYDIDPQFFAEHINVLSWYQMHEKVPERLPSLPSTKRAENFLSLKYVETRELLVPDDESSVLWPDESATRIRRSAGKLKPILGPARPAGPTGPAEQILPPVVFTRQTVSVWCQQKTDSEHWISIVLLDPPFQVNKRQYSLGQAEYRNPSLRPKLNETFHSDETGQTFREAFCRLLEHRCSTDKMYLRTCATNTFLTFYEAYRVIASEWLVVNEYVTRELANIGRHLEKPNSTFQELDYHLQELHRISRRCNKDRELIMEAALQCKNWGQALWPSSKVALDGNADAITFAEGHAEELKDDFKFVLDKISSSISRVEILITLVMDRVNISRGRQGLEDTRSISFLTRMVTIFVPISTVAAVLGIQTQYGPGAHYFWVLWVVTLPLTILVITIPSLYSRASASLSPLWTRYVSKPQTEPQDERIEQSNDPMLLMHRRVRGSVV